MNSDSIVNTETRSELAPNELEAVSGGASDLVKNTVVGVIIGVAAAVPFFGNICVASFGATQGYIMSNSNAPKK